MEPTERTVRVTRALERSVRVSQPPLRVRPGRTVTVLERSDEWPAFVLVKTTDGQVGWMPERYLAAERPRTRVRRAYDTTALEPTVGETLTVLTADPTSGWLWCRDADGRVGWYPMDFVDRF